MAQEDVDDLCNHVFELFDKRDGGQMKLRLFDNPSDFEDMTLSLFHPYFERLKPLLREWWNLLICAYKSYDEVTEGLIHDRVLIVLNKHLDLIRAGEGEMEPDEAETNDAAMLRRQKELERRRLDLHTLQLSPWTAGSIVESAVHDADNEARSDSLSAEVSGDGMWAYRSALGGQDPYTDSSQSEFVASESTNDGSDASPGPANLTRKLAAMTVTGGADRGSTSS
ncbi:hypothetical protein EUX98_g9089 [Antrodiella citrinella]|uniref:Uncharacterized protein n=1 Tax=Antrodiella citrinella TaxID=2447956 RepID=A0A4V6S1I0_9APHY|nr:hypothetical protein EUX98_g9089 [Antrodiella citrinella]